MAAIELDLVKILKNLGSLEEHGITEDDFSDIYSLNFIAQTNRGDIVCCFFYGGGFLLFLVTHLFNRLN